MERHDEQARKPTEYQKLNREARIKIAEGKGKGALGLLNKAMVLESKSVEACVNYSRAHFAHGEYAAAVRALLKAQEVNPDSALARYEDARLMVVKRDIVIALQSVQKAGE